MMSTSLIRCWANVRAGFRLAYRGGLAIARGERVSASACLVFTTDSLRQARDRNVGPRLAGFYARTAHARRAGDSRRGRLPARSPFRDLRRRPDVVALR